MQTGWFVYLRSFILYNKVCSQLCQKFLFGKSVQILHHTVIIDNSQLICREAYSHEIVIFFISAVIRILFGFFRPHQSCRRRAVVSVSYIQRRHSFKQFSNTGNIIIIIDDPERMAETIQFGYKIIFRSVCRIFLYDSIQLGIVRVSKENRFDISIVDTHMFHAVFFLITTGQLMFLNIPLQIIIHISTNYQPILCTSVHRLGIYVILFFLILNQPAVILKFPEILRCFFIDSRIMLVCSYRKINFRLDYMIQ